MAPGDPDPNPDPEVEFEIGRAKSGGATLCIGGRRAHSAYDPEAEAEQRAEQILREAGAASALSLIGSGAGHLARALRLRAPVPVLVWEPFAGVHAAVCRELGLEPEPVTSAREYADALRRALPGPGFAHPVVHPGYEDLTRFEQRHAVAAQRRRARANGVRSRAPRIVSERALAALERLPSLRAITELDGSLCGRTVVIASGGPSLDLVLPALREAPDVAVVAAPQALQRLIDARVRIDYAISVDPKDLLTPVLGEHDAPFGALLADTCAHPATLDRCPSRCFLFQLRSPQIVQQAWEAAGLPVIDEALITVSELAVHLARTLGARRLLLAGLDFVSDGGTYGECFRARGVDGSLVSTHSHYFHAARYLATALSGLDVVRVGDGVAVSGALPIAPAEIGGWLAEARPGCFGPVGATTSEALGRSVSALLAGPAPRPAENAVPLGSVWDDFAPLPEDELASRWEALRGVVG
ncbi:MAG: DUF115 domain-containing protein [Myxococcota bacterium]|nr:DUF115 domain-containing protein [Myxococcota bacterium]